MLRIGNANCVIGRTAGSRRWLRPMEELRIQADIDAAAAVVEQQALYDKEGAEQHACGTCVRQQSHGCSLYINSGHLVVYPAQIF